MDMTGSGDPVQAGEYCFSDDVHLGDIHEMFSGYHSTGDLFELVRRGGGNLAMSPPQLPQVLPEPPSEEEMAAWLYPIVCGEEFVADHAGGNSDVAAGLMAVGHQQVPTKEPIKQLMEKVRVKAPKLKCAEGTTSDSGDRRKTASGTRARKSNYSETHRLTEKRRRCKVNERFKTLQQLVPGCDKSSNQASTLDRTIVYMKSLQQQLQSMSSVTGCSMIPMAAVYPVTPPPYCILRSLPPAAGGDIDPTRMVSLAGPPMLPPLVHNAAVMMPVAPCIDPPDAGDYSKYNIPEAGNSISQRHKD